MQKRFATGNQETDSSFTFTLIVYSIRDRFPVRSTVIRAQTSFSRSLPMLSQGFNYFTFHNINKPPMFLSADNKIRSLLDQQSTYNTLVNSTICSLLSFQNSPYTHTSINTFINRSSHQRCPRFTIHSHFDSSKSFSCSSSPSHPHSRLSMSSKPPPVLKGPGLSIMSRCAKFSGGPSIWGGLVLHPVHRKFLRLIRSSQVRFHQCI